MDDHDHAILKDLSKLAKTRCREAALTVIQLIDSDMERSAVLAAIALEMLRGSATVMAEARKVPYEAALVRVFNTLATTIEKEAANVCATPDQPARQKRPRG